MKNRTSYFNMCLVLILAISPLAEAKKKAAAKKQAAEPQGRTTCIPQPKFPQEALLTQEIRKSELTKVLPKELEHDCAKTDRTALWTEIMEGLSYVESKWDTLCHNPSDHDGTPSSGLFQMTGKNVYYTPINNGPTLAAASPNDPRLRSVPCFNSHSETFDAKKNTFCGVWKMKELMNRGNSLFSNADDYWGPFGKKKFHLHESRDYVQQYKAPGQGGALVEFIKRACREKTVGKHNSSQYWKPMETYSPYLKSESTDSKRDKGNR